MGALDEGFSLDRDSIHQLRDDHNLLSSMVRSAGGRRAVLYPSNSGPAQAGAAQGRLTSALTPCDNALTGATTFTFARYVTDSEIDPQTDPVTMMEEVDDADPPVIVETDGVNRSKLEAAVDGHVVCVKINGEWVPVLVFDVCPE
jgi:hypothetical protein